MVLDGMAFKDRATRWTIAARPSNCRSPQLVHPATI